MPYLIDSDVLIDVSRGKPAARDYIDALPEGWAISQISALETHPESPPATMRSSFGGLSCGIEE
jgi:hypothetical protein